MKTDLLSVLEAACVAGVIALVGCGSDSSRSPDGQSLGAETGAGGPGVEAGCPGQEAGCPASAPADAQTPPIGAESAISAWLAKGDYKAWKCEPAPHDARPPGAHGKNRICSNALLSAHGAGEYPVGAAGVKELYDAAGVNIVGYAMYRKVAMGGGEAWYWFEKIQSGSLVANGLGTSGTPKTVCAGCHEDAGSDPSLSGHDFVYTQVK